MTIYLVTTGQRSDDSLEIEAVFSTQAKGEAHIAKNRAKHPSHWVKGAIDRLYHNWRDAGITELVLDEKCDE